MRSRRPCWWTISVALASAFLTGHTADIAAELGRRTGFGVVIATGFDFEPDTRDHAGRRYEVNRPFEGLPGRPPSEEGPLVSYAEIHGNSHPGAANRIEIATDGAAPRLEILIEPADTIRYAATGAKRAGILRLSRQALHIELPKAARVEWRETYTAILADFLVQAVPLPPGP
jgi:hypothetical protein